MAIIGTDLHLRGATTAGAAGNSTAYGGVGTSLGKYITNNDLTDATLNNQFPDTTGDENAASQVDYQCMFIYNAHGSLTLQNAVVWINTEVAGGDSHALAADSTAASAVGAAGAQALIIANKNTAPAALSFPSPGTQNSKAAGVSLGNIGPGQVKAFWVQRVAANSAALNNDGGQFRVEGDTVA